jgi:protein-disulfide isomerase
MTKKTAAGLAIAAFCVIAVFSARHFVFPRVRFTEDQRTLLRSHGEPGSPIWVVEYLDYQCPPCKMASESMKGIFRKYPSLVYSQVRFFPLVKHPYALKASLYAECAARQGKFWEFHDTLFDRQLEWSQAKPGEVDAWFEGYARGSGLDVKNLTACVEDPATEETVLKEAESGKAMGVAVTPTFFVNGRMAVGLEGLTEELDGVLALKSAGKK